MGHEPSTYALQLLSLTVVGPASWWGLIGLVPLVTARPIPTR